jgi:ankyrin repeat protein
VLLDTGLDIHATNKKGQTPLAIAAARGCESVAELLLNHSAQLKSQGDAGHEVKDKSGHTPLVVAAQHGQSNVVMDLIQNNADIDIRDPDGRTPLALAAENGYASS